jgi:hypothetical protein
MKKTIILLLNIFYATFTIAQVSLVHTFQSVVYPHFDNYSCDSPLPLEYYYSTAGNFPNGMGSASWSHTIPCTYYDANYNIIEQITFSCINNVLTVSSSGVINVTLSSFSLPTGYDQVQSVYFSKHLYNADDLFEFRIVVVKSNAASYDNNKYARIIVNSAGNIISDIAYSAVIPTESSHYMINNIHYFSELSYSYDSNYDLSGISKIYSCTGPNMPSGNDNVHDTIVVTIHDTVLVNDTPYYNLEVRSDNPIHGIPVGNGLFPQNCNVEIGVIPIENWQFIRWNDGDEQNPRIVNVQSNETYTALFQATSVSSYTTIEPWLISVNSNVITIEGATNYPIRLFDISGRCLQIISDAESQEHISVMASGVYFLQIGNNAAKKVVVQ